MPDLACPQLAGFLMTRNTIIAVLEDDASLRDAIDNLLRSSGFQTILFASADAYFEAQAPTADLLITDVRMPGTTGLALQDMLRAQGNRIPIIVITALLDATVSARALDLGAVACLLKPFDETALLDAIAQALTRGPQPE
jgi:FixJ family two-component response regulator